MVPAIGTRVALPVLARPVYMRWDIIRNRKFKVMWLGLLCGRLEPVRLLAALLECVVHLVLGRGEDIQYIQALMASRISRVSRWGHRPPPGSALPSCTHAPVGCTRAAVVTATASLPGSVMGSSGDTRGFLVPLLFVTVSAHVLHVCFLMHFW